MAQANEVKPAGVIEIAVYAAEHSCADAACRPADQSGGDRTHHAGVDHRALKGKPRVGTADGEQSEDDAQHELVLQRAVLPLEHHAQWAQLGEDGGDQHKKADIQNERKEEVILHGRPFPRCTGVVKIFTIE